MLEGPIRDHARWSPRATAVVTPNGMISYAQFDADIDRFGAAFLDLGVGPRSGVVALQLDQPYLHYVAICALARIGAVSAPGHDADADLRITTGNDTLPNQPTLRLGPDALASIRAAPARPLPACEPDPDSIARVMLTSGSTRKPRRIGLSWRRLENANSTALRSYGAGRVGGWIPMTGIDSMLGYSLAMAAWSTGAATTTQPLADRVVEWLETIPPGILGATPIQLHTLLGALPPRFQPKPAWRIICAGSVLPVAIAREISLRVTPDVVINYGATESSLNALCRLDLQAPPGVVGHTPAGATLEVLAPDGQTGEIRIRSNRMTYGYLDDPAASAERFREGWFYPGDMGRRLPDGRLVLEGRVDDRMNFGGRKFMPGEIEGPAMACPGVLDCAAFAAPGAKGIDQCWLAVVTAPEFDRDSLAVHLSKYEGLPENRFAWIDAIPRNAMGKIERGKLRDALIAALRTGGG